MNGWIESRYDIIETTFLRHYKRIIGRIVLISFFYRFIYDRLPQCAGSDFGTILKSLVTDWLCERLSQTDNESTCGLRLLIKVAKVQTQRRGFQQEEKNKR